jgi:hypothetical protein
MVSKPPNSGIWNSVVISPEERFALLGCHKFPRGRERLLKVAGFDLWVLSMA